MLFLFQYLGQFGGVHTKLLQLRPRGAKVGVKTRMAVAHDGSMGQTVYLPTNLHKKQPNVGIYHKYTKSRISCGYTYISGMAPSQNASHHQSY